MIPHGVMSGLVLVRLHTDAGTVDGEPVVGHGESYYLPHAVAAVLHDWMARRLLGVTLIRAFSRIVALLLAAIAVNLIRRGFQAAAM